MKTRTANLAATDIDDSTAYAAVTSAKKGKRTRLDEPCLRMGADGVCNRRQCDYNHNNLAECKAAFTKFYSQHNCKDALYCTEDHCVWKNKLKPKENSKMVHKAVAYNDASRDDGTHGVRGMPSFICKKIISDPLRSSLVAMYGTDHPATKMGEKPVVCSTALDSRQTLTKTEMDLHNCPHDDPKVGMLDSGANTNFVKNRDLLVDFVHITPSKLDLSNSFGVDLYYYFSNCM